MKRHAEAKSNLQFWIGLLLPPVAWLFQMQTTYALIQYACIRNSTVPLHTSEFLFFCVSLAGAILSLKCWRSSGRHWPADTDEGMHGARRMIASLGIMSGALFSLIIIGQWLPLWFIDPCAK